MSYIGQTQTSLNLRINNHRSHSKLHKHNSFELQHFAFHSFQGLTLDILDIIPNAKDRLFKESLYILKHKTLYPYGLNTHLNNQINTNSFSIFHLFLLYTNFNIEHFSKHMRKRGSRSTPNKFINFAELTIQVEELLYTKDFIKAIKTKIFSLKRKTLKAFTKFILQYEFKNQHLFKILIDLIQFRFQKDISQIVSPPKEKIFMTLQFSHKTLNDINFHKLFMSPQVYNALPMNNKPQLSIGFQFTKTLGRQLFNYNTLPDLTSDVKLECICHKFPEFINTDHGHIISNHARFLDDENLNQLLNKGTKYRMVPKFNRNKIIENFSLDLDRAIFKLSRLYSLPLSTFICWKNRALNTFINLLPLHSEIIHDFYPAKSIQQLKEFFVISYIDKSPGAFSFI